MQFTEQGKQLWQQLEIAGLKAIFKDSHYMTKYLVEAESLQNVLNQKGLGYPTIGEFMDQINAGEAMGYTLATQQHHLEEYRKDLEDLLAGRIRGDKIVGRGRGGKKAAIQWLNAKITELNLSITVSGIGKTVNISNYTSHLWKIHKQVSAAA